MGRRLRHQSGPHPRGPARASSISTLPRAGSASVATAISRRHSRPARAAARHSGERRRAHRAQSDTRGSSSECALGLGRTQIAADGQIAETMDLSFALECGGPEPAGARTAAASSMRRAHCTARCRTRSSMRPCSGSGIQHAGIDARSLEAHIDFDASSAQRLRTSHARAQPRRTASARSSIFRSTLDGTRCEITWRA